MDLLDRVELSLSGGRDFLLPPASVCYGKKQKGGKQLLKLPYERSHIALGIFIL